MKNFKTLFVGAALIAVTSAFAVKGKNPPVDYWVAGNAQNNAYTITASAHPLCGTGSSIVCQIRSSATPSGTQITAVGAIVLLRRP